MQIWEMFKKCQNYRFFDIFWDILNKMKDNLGQECVKGGLLSFQGKYETIALGFPGKMTFSSSFDPTFPPVPLENLAFPPVQKLHFSNEQ